MAGTLTARQRQVWRLRALGASYEQIALTLGISKATVHNHIKAIYSHLGITNQSELTLCAVRAHVVTDADIDARLDSMAIARRDWRWS